MRIRDPRARKLLGHPALFFLAGFIVAMLVPGPSIHLKPYILTPMIVVMYLSTTEIRFKALLDVRGYGPKVVGCVLLNYGFVSVVTLVLARSFIQDGDLFTGFVLVAAMPTAIAVIPLSYIMKGNMEVALVGVALSYILALGLAPGMVHVLLGSSFDVWRIFEALIFVIVLPLLASRLLIRLEIDAKLGLGKDIMVNICFFFVMYTIIGVNYDSFFLGGGSLLVVVLIAIARSCGTGVICLGACKLANVKRKDAVTYVFFSSFKNLGITAALALALFGNRASIPAALGAPIELITFIVLMALMDWVLPKGKDGRDGKEAITGTKK